MMTEDEIRADERANCIALIGMFDDLPGPIPPPIHAIISASPEAAEMFSRSLVLFTKIKVIAMLRGINPDEELSDTDKAILVSDLAMHDPRRARSH